MKEHLHVYCDESGGFERTGKEASIIAGMLIPHQQIQGLSNEYIELCKKHGFASFSIHGKDLCKERNFPGFIEELVEITVERRIKLTRMTYRKDTISKSAAAFGSIEAAYCNRYLYAIQSFLEQVIFLNPDNYGKELAFSLHPNRRIFSLPDTMKNKVKNLGFSLSGNESSKCDEEPKNSIKVIVWNEQGLRIFLNRLQTDYGLFAETIGKRDYKKIETPVGCRSQDPFVHWIDNLAMVMRWPEYRYLESRLKEQIILDAEYSPEAFRYKELCTLFLKGDDERFVVMCLDEIRGITNGSYRKHLSDLMNKSLERFRDVTDKTLENLEKNADQLLRSSSGNWAFVACLVEYLLTVIRNMPDEKKHSTKIRGIVFRLLNHKLSCLNHRGDVKGGWAVVREAETHGFSFSSINEWREQVEFVNRQAVTAANVFDFTSFNQRLERLIRSLESARDQVSACAGYPLKDDIIGKVYGTLAQNYAFLTPFDASSRIKGEECFLKAKNEFDKPADIQRQDSYLAHFYMDGDDREKVRSVMDRIFADPAVKAFWDNPSKENSKYMGFPLTLMLKFQVWTGEGGASSLERFPLKTVKDLFGAVVMEHPFEFVFAYLGRLAMHHGMKDRAALYFLQALKIPGQGKLEEQPTILAIHAQIRIHWALALDDAGETDMALEQRNMAMNHLRLIGNDPLLSPMLELKDDHAVSGWFAQPFNSLKETGPAGTINRDACTGFLRYFTFNYR